MISVDVEASGVNPDQHSILSIGALDVDEPENQFYGECRMWNGAKNDPEAAAINGFDDAAALDVSKQSEAELIAGFFAWAMDKPRDRTLVAQNIAFDTSFLQTAAERAGIEYPFAKRTLDLHTLVWLHMQQFEKLPSLESHHSSISLRVAARYCGIPEEQKPHNGMTGALLHAEIASRIAYTKNLLNEYSEYPIPWTNH